MVKKFNCSLNYTDEECEEIFRERDEYIGGSAEVTHDGFTGKDTIPKFPKAVAIFVKGVK